MTKAYKLLTDYKILIDNAIISKKEARDLLSPNLSHKYSKFFVGRLYLRYYYAPMIISALEKSKKGNFLELGCGTGTQVILAKQVGFLSGFGIDANPERIHIAKKRSQFYKVEESLTFKMDDFWKIDLATTFDAIYSMFAFELFGSPPVAACQRLVNLCSEEATIILDMGRVRHLYKNGYFSEVISELSNNGFTVSIEPLIPFLTGTKLAKMFGEYRLWPFFRAVRLIASR